jgi:hypothetical protein
VHKKGYYAMLLVNIFVVERRKGECIIIRHLCIMNCFNEHVGKHVKEYYGVVSFNECVGNHIKGIVSTYDEL